MKKAAVIVLVLSILVCMFACNTEENVNATSEKDNTASSTVSTDRTKSEESKAPSENLKNTEKKPTASENENPSSEKVSESSTKVSESPAKNSEPTRPTQNTSGTATTPSTESTQHVHSYKSSITQAATCTANGTKEYKCSCGNSYTESIPATGHNWVEASCTEPKTCRDCGYTEGEALGHYFFNGSTTCLLCGYTMPFSFNGNIGVELVFKNKVSQFGDQILAKIRVDSIYLNEVQNYVYITCTPTYVMAEGATGSTSVYCSARIYDGSGNLVKSVDRSTYLTELHISTGSQFTLKYPVDDLSVGTYYFELCGGNYAGDVTLY